MAGSIGFISQFGYAFDTAIGLDVQFAFLNDSVADGFAQTFPERVGAKHANGNGRLGIWKRIRRPFNEQGKLTQKGRLQIIFLGDLPEGRQAGKTQAENEHCAESPANESGRAPQQKTQAWHSVWSPGFSRPSAAVESVSKHFMDPAHAAFYRLKPGLHTRRLRSARIKNAMSPLRIRRAESRGGKLESQIQD